MISWNSRAILLFVLLVVRVHAFVLSSRISLRSWGGTTTFLAKANLDQDMDSLNVEIKRQLLDLIAATPSNLPTSKRQTDKILCVVRSLELQCPTADEDVVDKLAGNWELLWTAQDQTSDEWGLGPLRTWIK
jgi:hypothetical protein